MNRPLTSNNQILTYLDYELAVTRNWRGGARERGRKTQRRGERRRERGGERVRDREGRVSTERGERGRGQGQGIGEGHAGGGAGGGGVMKVLWLHEGIESCFCVAPFFLVFGVSGIIADILVPCCSRT